MYVYTSFQRNEEKQINIHLELQVYLGAVDNKLMETKLYF